MTGLLTNPLQRSEYLKLQTKQRKGTLSPIKLKLCINQNVKNVYQLLNFLLIHQFPLQNLLCFCSQACAIPAKPQGWQTFMPCCFPWGRQMLGNLARIKIWNAPLLELNCYQNAPLLPWRGMGIAGTNFQYITINIRGADVEGGLRGL